MSKRNLQYCYNEVFRMWHLFNKQIEKQLLKSGWVKIADSITVGNGYSNSPVYEKNGLKAHFFGSFGRLNRITIGDDTYNLNGKKSLKLIESIIFKQKAE